LERKGGVVMRVKEYEWYLRHLTEHVNMRPSEIEFVDNVAEWCQERGIEEPDVQRPLRLVATGDRVPHLVVSREIAEPVLEERINAFRMRSQLRNLREDRADRLNSPTKKVAFLFLKEFSLLDPALAYDEPAADEWVFEQMERVGMLGP
jgi:hypothetical protein